jgi:hypothetical protein
MSMEPETALWIDARGQYYAKVIVEGTQIVGIGATALEAFLACWEAVVPWVVAGQTVSETSRPHDTDVL